jgi:hypothetical protein
MNRALLLAVPAFATLAMSLPDMAEAKSKAYCRQWATDVANRSAGTGATVGATAGNVLSTMGQVLVGTVTANQAMPADPPKTAPATNDAERQKIYRRAYAECRAS